MPVFESEVYECIEAIDDSNSGALRFQLPKARAHQEILC